MYLEQMFMANLYLWHLSWEKAIAFAVEQGKPQPAFKDIPQPKGLLDMFALQTPHENGIFSERRKQESFAEDMAQLSTPLVKPTSEAVPVPPSISTPVQAQISTPTPAVTDEESSDAFKRYKEMLEKKPE